MRQTIYLCDHRRNTSCRKTGCIFSKDAIYKQCCCTTDINFAKCDTFGRPLTVQPDRHGAVYDDKLIIKPLSAGKPDTDISIDDELHLLGTQLRFDVRSGELEIDEGGD